MSRAALHQAEDLSAFQEEYVDEVVYEVRNSLLEMARRLDMKEQLGPPKEAAERLVSLVPSRSPWGAVVGPVYDTSQVRALLGAASRQAVGDRARRRTVLALHTGDGHVVYPVFQFKGREVIPGLSKVLQRVSDTVDDWTLASWLRAPQPALGGRSIVEQLARRGADEQVIEVADAAAERWST
ncbi:MAG: hypothetical protein ABSC00_04690 [Acidimicrobiales bacterium]|jgi:hypothetical protein